MNGRNNNTYKHDKNLSLDISLRYLFSFTYSNTHPESERCDTMCDFE